MSSKNLVRKNCLLRSSRLSYASV